MIIWRRVKHILNRLVHRLTGSQDITTRQFPTRSRYKTGPVAHFISRTYNPTSRVLSRRPRKRVALSQFQQPPYIHCDAAFPQLSLEPPRGNRARRADPEKRAPRPDDDNNCDYRARDEWASSARRTYPDRSPSRSASREVIFSFTAHVSYGRRGEAPMKSRDAADELLIRSPSVFCLLASGVWDLCARSA